MRPTRRARPESRTGDIVVRQEYDTFLEWQRDNRLGFGGEVLRLDYVSRALLPGAFEHAAVREYGLQLLPGYHYAVEPKSVDARQPRRGPRA